MAELVRGTVLLPWKAPGASNLDAATATLKPVGNVNILDILRGVLGCDVLLAESVQRFAEEDEWLAEWDMGAQYDTLEPYDAS